MVMGDSDGSDADDVWKKLSAEMWGCRVEDMVPMHLCLTADDLNIYLYPIRVEELAYLRWYMGGIHT